MNNINNISLFKFQQIEEINNSDLQDIDKTLFSVCTLFNLTEYELDNMPVKRANRLIVKTGKIFQQQLKAKPQKRIGWYFANYDISKMTFGQYVELAFFTQDNMLKKAHYILASITHKLFRKNDSNKHSKKAQYFLHQPIGKIVGTLNKFVENFEAFNNEYKSLFGLDVEVSGSDAKAAFFNKRYGWIYCASQIAEYERITLEQAYELPVRQALNDLAYLKAKTKYELEQSKKR